MERFGPGGNFPVKVVHLQRWSSLTSRSGPTENCRSVFRNCRFQSRSSSSQHTVVKMADSSDVSVYECSVCQLQTQDLNFVLMHSCTQGQGRATHLDLFFVLVFIGFQRQIYYGLLRMLTMFSRVFLLAVCDPSPYDNTQQLIRSEFWVRCVPFSLNQCEWSLTGWSGIMESTPELSEQRKFKKKIVNNVHRKLTQWTSCQLGREYASALTSVYVMKRFFFCINSP